MEKKYIRDKRSPIPKSEQISKVMSSIRSSNTQPEIKVRKALFTESIRGYRVNFKLLPGKPDIAFTKHKLAIFINGSYWHGCVICCWKPPKHNTEYWVNKIATNRLRDFRKIEAIKCLGYRAIVIWEHDIKNNIDKVVSQISGVLNE